MNLEMLDGAIDGTWAYMAFLIIFLGIIAAIALAEILGTFFFRWMVLKSIGVMRRRAFYVRWEPANIEEETTTWKL